MPRSDRLPLTSCGVKVVLGLEVAGRSKREPWKSAKKNSLFFLTGPPTVPPYSFQRGRGRPLKLLDHSLALKKSLRRYSNRLPWNWLVPDLRLTLMTPPRNWPNSALGLLVITLNSAMASTLGERATLLSTNSVFSMPSRR